MREIPELYELAKKICHKHGLPWTDPRTGITHQPPKISTAKTKRIVHRNEV